jgi:Protein of unknown function (DUF3168)
MSAFAWECQKALYAVLNAANLASGGVFDSPPQTVTYPWIEIADGQIIPDDTSAADGGSDAGVNDFFDLHVWSRVAGKREVKTITDGLFDLLHEASLTIPGRASALCWVRTVRYLLDPDDITRHAVVSIQIIHRT